MPWSKQQIRLFLGVLLIVGFIGMVGAMLFVEIPTANADIVKVLVGFLGGAFVTMVGFYFGSSEE
jgi:pilus assembly protein TadC